MKLEQLVAASEATAATRKRSLKIETLAAVFAEAGAAEAPIAAGFLCGRPRQGKIGIGWAGVRDVEVEPATSASLTLVEVDERLSELAGLAGAGVEARRRECLGALLARASAAEQRFLRRLLTGELRQGALEGVVTDAVAVAAGAPKAAVRRALMLTGDLGETARIALGEGATALEAVGLRLLRGLKPMLAASAESVEEAIGELGRAFVEWKLDGVRVQAHRHGDEVRIYTRNLNEVTARLPEVVAAVKALELEAVVLDGEAISLHDDARPVPFQDAMSRFGREVDGERAMRPFYFDCLHLDGRDLIDEPFSVRRRALEDVVGDAVTPGQMLDDAAAAASFLEEALAAGHEGVMVKDPASPYQAGRRGRAWRKVKPVVTVDLVVLGAEWGSGRRQGWLSNLHLGARAGERDLVMVGKTFKGLSDELLAWQTRELLERELERERHLVRVRPELVVEIALDGVQRSSRYPGGVALRFARVKSYRPDKDPSEATSIDELRKLLPATGAARRE